MKNKSTKIFVLTLAAALVLCASFAFTSNAETETTPEIISQNVNYTDKFYLMQ